MIGMPCHGVCTSKHGAQDAPRGGRPPAGPDHKIGAVYPDNLGFCSICAVWIRWEGLRCPCCSTVLRRRTRCHRSRGIARQAAERRAVAALEV